MNTGLLSLTSCTDTVTVVETLNGMSPESYASISSVSSTSVSKSNVRLRLMTPEEVISNESFPESRISKLTTLLGADMSPSNAVTCPTVSPTPRSKTDEISNKAVREACATNEQFYTSQHILFIEKEKIIYTIKSQCLLIRSFLLKQGDI